MKKLKMDHTEDKELEAVERYYDTDGNLICESRKKNTDESGLQMKVPIKVEVYMDNAKHLLEISKKVDELRNGQPYVEARYVIDLRRHG